MCLSIHILNYIHIYDKLTSEAGICGEFGATGNSVDQIKWSTRIKIKWSMVNKMGAVFFLIWPLLGVYYWSSGVQRQGAEPIPYFPFRVPYFDLIFEPTRYEIVSGRGSSEEETTYTLSANSFIFHELIIFEENLMLVVCFVQIIYKLMDT